MNAILLKELFPRFDDVMQEIQVDLIMGLPSVYEAVTQVNEKKIIVLLDVANIAKHIGYKDIGLTLKSLMSREFCHLLLYDKYPELVDLETDYKSKLDKGTFVKGFSGLFTYLGIEFEDVEWKTVRMTSIQEQCQGLMLIALNATEEKEQERFLKEAFSGMYSNRFAHTCGMMHFAEQWEAEGVDGLARTLEQGWDGFALKTCSCTVS